MRINTNPSYDVSFHAINRKYLKWAQKDYIHCNNINVNWFHQFGDDVCLFETISQKDMFDTLRTVKNYISYDSNDYFNNYVKECKEHFKRLKH